MTDVQTIVAPILAAVAEMGDMPVTVASVDLEALYRQLGHEWPIEEDWRDIDAMALEALCKAALRIEALEAALLSIKLEVERPNGGFVHLKRLVSLAVRQALEGERASQIGEQP